MALVKDGIKMIEPQILTKYWLSWEIKKAGLKITNDNTKKKKSCKQNMNDNINRKHLKHMSVLFSLSWYFYNAFFPNNKCSHIFCNFVQYAAIEVEKYARTWHNKNNKSCMECKHSQYQGYMRIKSILLNLLCK